MIPILLTIFALMAPIPAIDAAALKKEQEAAWKDLSNWEETVASRALLTFSNRPNETVKFLKGVLKPLKIDEATVKKLTEDLASDDEKVWKPAFETFEYLDPRLAVTLQKCYDDATPGPGRQRMVAILCDTKADKYEGKNVQLSSTGKDSFLFSSEGSSWWAEQKVSQLANTRRGNKQTVLVTGGTRHHSA